jgi:hypothetical protein
VRTVIALALVLTGTAIAFATGFAFADSRAPEGEPTTEATQSAPTYEEGLDEGYATGFDDGRSEGIKIGKDVGSRNGYRKGMKAGREAGYSRGLVAGKAEGFRDGQVDGCEAVFDELDTDRVIDGPANPGQRYWNLNRDQCRYARNW